MSPGRELTGKRKVCATRKTLAPPRPSSTVRLPLLHTGMLLAWSGWVIDVGMESARRVVPFGTRQARDLQRTARSKGRENWSDAPTRQVGGPTRKRLRTQACKARGFRVHRRKVERFRSTLTP